MAQESDCARCPCAAGGGESQLDFNWPTGYHLKDSGMDVPPVEIDMADFAEEMRPDDAVGMQPTGASAGSRQRRVGI